MPLTAMFYFVPLLVSPLLSLVPITVIPVCVPPLTAEHSIIHPSSVLISFSVHLIFLLSLHHISYPLPLFVFLRFLFCLLRISYFARHLYFLPPIFLSFYLNNLTSTISFSLLPQYSAYPLTFAHDSVFLFSSSHRYSLSFPPKLVIDFSYAMFHFSSEYKLSVFFPFYVLPFPHSCCIPPWKVCLSLVLSFYSILCYLLISCFSSGIASQFILKTNRVFLFIKTYALLFFSASF